MRRTIYMSKIDTPLGQMIVCCVDEGVCLLEFADRQELAVEMEQMEHLLQATISVQNHANILQCEEELTAYFRGERKTFTVPLVMMGTEFQQLVWRKLQEIPYGKTRTYKQQAKELDKLKAIRAVAGANGSNKIAIIIPCHRVIGSDGALTGYAGGLQRKQWLLQHEQGKTQLNIDWE
jgi:AraC family transcriptional regulator, regulatory protein of adaptative response / methylated-DNA-[protein]-cysteine methyltransferase